MRLNLDDGLRCQIFFTLKPTPGSTQFMIGAYFKFLKKIASAIQALLDFCSEIHINIHLGISIWLFCPDKAVHKIRTFIRL